MPLDPASSRRRFLVGDRLAQPDLNRLVEGGDADGAIAVTHQVEPRVMETLVFLARHAGEVVSRREIMDALWGETVVVEAALTRAVSELRNLLGDDSKSPRYIETIRKGGYRLIAGVEWLEETENGATNGRPAGVGQNGVAAAPPRTGGGGRGDTPRRRRVRWPFALLALLIPALILLNIRLRGAAPEAAPGVIEGRPFTTFPGAECYPALSPDGTQVAFCWHDPEVAPANLDIFVKQRNTETPLRLTRHPGHDLYPAWSPDGTRIAFFRSDDGARRIMTVPGIGGEARALAEIPSWPLGLDWSPDGRFIAYAAMSTDTCPDAIFLLDVADGTSTPLPAGDGETTGDAWPRFSPDGDRIAFVRSDPLGRQDLYVTDLAGSAPRRVTRGHRLIHGHDWLADGNSLLFSSMPLARSLLWRVDVETAEFTRLPCTSEGIRDLTLAADGGCLVYETSRSELNIWAVHDATADSTAANEPFIRSTRWDTQPAFSSNDSRIAFISTRTGGAEVWICDRNGRQPAQCTFDTGGDIRNPFWSPDDRYIGFTVSRGDTSIIQVMESCGGPARSLTDGEHRDVGTAWSRDGEWIYFDSDRDGDWNVWKIQVVSGEVRRVTENGGLSAREGLNGEHLYFVKLFQSGIYSMPTAGGKETCITSYHSLGDCSNWGVLTDGLYFATYLRGEPVIGRCGFDGAGERLIMGVPNMTMGSLTATSDGSTYLYARKNTREIDLMLVEKLP